MATHAILGVDGLGPCGDAVAIRELADGTVVAVVVDVAGHGRSLAMLSAHVSTGLIAMLSFGIDLTEAMMAADRGFRSERGPDGPEFASAFAALVEPQTRRLRYVSAGHEPAMLLAIDGTPRRLETNGCVLGTLDAPSFPQNVAYFAEGDRLVVVSDGVTESRDSAGHMFGDAGVRQVLSGWGCARGGAPAVIRAAAAHSRDGLRDDACALIVQLCAPADAA